MVLYAVTLRWSSYSTFYEILLGIGILGGTVLVGYLQNQSLSNKTQDLRGTKEKRSQALRDEGARCNDAEVQIRLTLLMTTLGLLDVVAMTLYKHSKRKNGKRSSFPDCRSGIAADTRSHNVWSVESKRVIVALFL
jgi:hypothetical protein